MKYENDEEARRDERKERSEALLSAEMMINECHDCTIIDSC
jgi:hypothetical protein